MQHYRVDEGGLGAFQEERVDPQPREDGRGGSSRGKDIQVGDRMRTGQRGGARRV